MNTNILRGKWKQVVGSAREEWGKLTNDDLEQVAGEKDRLVGKIQEQYGITRDEAETQVDSWAEREPSL